MNYVKEVSRHFYLHLQHWLTFPPEKLHAKLIQCFERYRITPVLDDKSKKKTILKKDGYLLLTEDAVALIVKDVYGVYTQKNEPTGFFKKYIARPTREVLKMQQR